MRTHLFRWSRRARLDERGVALPLALFGLVTISILVTAALVTSSTEAAVSSAQSSATVGLYQVEAAIQRHVAAKNGAFAAGTVPVVLNARDTVVVTVARLFQSAPAAAPGALGTAIYSLRGESSRGGRSVVAMISLPVAFANFKIEAGASLGSDADIGGSIDVNSTSSLCASDTAKDAVVHAAGTELTIRGQAKTNIGSDTSTFGGDREAMARSILGQTQLDDLARRADIRFGAMFDTAAFSGRPSYNNTNPKLRWGCPSGLGIDCPAADTAYFPLVAIDAARSDGTRGSVTLEGDHGQGLLLVLNGDLIVRGNFRYKGIIMVEGNTDIHGGSGGQGSKIEGALIGFGDLEICNDGSDGDCSSSLGGTSDLSSGAVIQYNRCALDNVQDAINSRPMQQKATQPTFSWFEVVR